ncbi:MAG: hypothetical protein AB7I68_02125 [Porticoccaceae bacterium]
MARYKDDNRDQLKMIPVALLNRCFFVVFILSVFFTNASNSESIPSCYEIVKTKTKAGASPNCAPLIINNDIAFDVINYFNGKRISYDWYFFVAEKDSKMTYKAKWDALSLFVSSVQSLYEENSDIYFVIYPESDREKSLINLGQYPAEKIIGYAKYVLPKNPFSSNKDHVFPENHHKRIYKLIVY